MIIRSIENQIDKQLHAGRVIVVLGPRQAGKTTLVNKICSKRGEFLSLSGDDPHVVALLESAGENQLRQIISNHKIVLIDEAQRIPGIGIIAKIIHDQINGVQLILSGSSALEIADKLNEPLTGRKWEHLLYPVLWEELSRYAGYHQSNLNLNTRLIYGMYPAVITAGENPQPVLRELTSSYLYKDILQLAGIRKPEALEKLLVALALQIGSEVNFNELANTLRIDRNTVENYVALLEKCFVIFKLKPLSSNMRIELTTGRKIYFHDNGIRNALLGNFTPVELRTDIGQLWENFVISERLKRNSNHARIASLFYWRSYQQQEIDLIELSDNKLSAIECKWKSDVSKRKFAKTFTAHYNPSRTLVVTPANFSDFLMEAEK